MKRDAGRAPLGALLWTLLVLVGCGGPESELAPIEESLGTHEGAVCAGSSVSALSISGISTYMGDMAGSGSWTVVYPANAVRLEYYVDNVLHASEERVGGTGTWYFSTSGVACGTRTFLVKAIPMVVDSAGSRTTCWTSLSKTATKSVLESCPSVTGGNAHSVALKRDGTVWGWGLNSYGNLGDGTTIQRTSPVQTLGLTGVTAIAAGSFHTVALKQDGTVWAWGSNSYGQLGDGTLTQRNSPVKVGGSLTGVTAIAAGGYFTLALKSDGTLWVWGRNNEGQLGLGTQTHASTPVKVTSISGVKAINGGFEHTVVVKTDGTVWSWGRNDYGQIGDGTLTRRLSPVKTNTLVSVSTIAGGHSHSLAVKTDGTLWAWGYNAFGQVGDGTTTNRSSPVRVTSLTGVKFVFGSVYSSRALKTDGTVRGWGLNSSGQLGDGTTTNRLTPVLISGISSPMVLGAGDYNTQAVKTDGTVWVWGSNSFGQIGDGTTTKRLTPTKVPNFFL